MYHNFSSKKQISFSNVVLVSAVEQRDAVKYIYIYPVYKRVYMYSFFFLLINYLLKTDYFTGLALGSLH